MANYSLNEVVDILLTLDKRNQKLLRGSESFRRSRVEN